MTEPMTYSPACVRIVKPSEGLFLSAYLCPAGVWTIGWGHTAGVQEHQQITHQEAEAFLEQDLSYTANSLSSILPTGLRLNQNQFDALCSLCFNLKGGARMLPYLAPKMWGDLLRGDLKDADTQFLNMDHALVQGRMAELLGLKLRRQAEAALFATPTEAA